MGRLVISLFLLSISALSSSNIIPLTAHKRSISEFGQFFENTSNKKDNRAANNPCASETKEFTELCNIIEPDTYRREPEPDGTVIGIEDRNNGIDQLHNYPRQLDYLLNYGQVYNADDMNSFLQTFSDQNEDRSQSLESADSNNELINKVNAIHDQTYGIQFKPVTRRSAIILDPGKSDQEYLTHNDIGDNDLKTALYMLEIRKKAAENHESDNFDESETPAIPHKSDLKTVVKKRYISLWSRLQAMSPSNRAHELPHRRHLHLFYHHLPEDIDGRPIPEDPRTLFKRPPGSPLRWG